MIDINKNRYILDSNIFIQAYRTYYAFDICPGFWDFLVHNFKKNSVSSIDWVRKELKTGDNLDNWISKHVSNDIFLKTDDSNSTSVYKSIMNWVQQNSQFKLSAKSEFANIADGWLVAFCSAKKFTLVTQETYDEFVKKKIPIPNICKEFKVDYIDTYELIRQLNGSFHIK